jgi:hypothetical protein
MAALADWFANAWPADADSSSDADIEIPPEPGARPDASTSGTASRSRLPLCEARPADAE